MFVRPLSSRRPFCLIPTMPQVGLGLCSASTRTTGAYANLPLLDEKYLNRVTTSQLAIVVWELFHPSFFALLLLNISTKYINKM